MRLPIMDTHVADVSLLRFGRLEQPVAFVDCRQLVDVLPRYFRNWNIVDVSDTGDVDPIITVTRSSTGYDVSASWLKPSLHRRDDVDVVCALIAELIRASVDADTEYLCLHAAAVEIAGRLVVFPNPFRAGKSLLCACLASHGCRIFADDVIPLVGSVASACAPGVLPRLRLPLPESLASETHTFLACHRGPSNSHYLYLDLPKTHLFEHGERAAIGAVVLLNRLDDGPALLEPITRSRALRQTIWQNFGRESGPVQILSRLQTAVSRTAVCYQLDYARVDDAAQLLLTEFLKQDATPPIASILSSVPQGRDLSSTTTLPAAGSCQRRTGLSETRMDGELYLADNRTGAIHQLDSIGMAIWDLLAEPTTPEQVSAELSLAFPDVPHARIAEDVAALLHTLAKKRLISRL